MVIAGGVIPAQDYDFLYKAGVAAIFGPGTSVAKAACEMMKILLDKELGPDKVPIPNNQVGGKQDEAFLLLSFSNLLKSRSAGFLFRKRKNYLPDFIPNLSLSL